MKTGSFSINKRCWGTGRAPKGFHNLTLFKSTNNSKGGQGQGRGGPPLPCPRMRGIWQSSCEWGASPLHGVTSHMLGTGMRLTLMFQRKGSLYLAVGGDKAEATQATTSPQGLGQSGDPLPPKFVQDGGPEQSISHG